MKQHVYRFGMLGLFLFAISMTTGCAFVDNKVELPYTQCISGYRGNGEIEIEKPQVSLPQKDGLTIVGYVRNGFQMHTADVMATNNVADWVVLALSKELGAAGYEVYPVSSLSNNGIGLRISNMKVLADIVSFRLVANVEYNIDIYDSNGHIQIISAKGEGTFLSTNSIAESYARSLEIALQNSMKEAVPKIILSTGGNR